MSKFNVGDTVHLTVADSVKWAGNYKVVKVNPTTYGLERMQDGARLKAGHEMVRPGTLPDGTLTMDRDQPIVMADPIQEHFQTGAVVHMKNVRGVDPSKHWVITGQTARGYRLFPLGGSTRYYTGISASRLVRVTEIDGWKA